MVPIQPRGAVTTTLLTRKQSRLRCPASGDYENSGKQHAGPKQNSFRWGRRAPIARRSCGAPRTSQAGIYRRACPGKISVATLREFIDWTPFFHTWELRGVYPSS